MAGVYGWHFEQSPHPDLDTGRLLYVGMAPRYMANRTSTQNLRERVRCHYRGNNARVCWIERSEPWDLESQFISRLDLPLNLDQNRRNAFHSRLKGLRAEARRRARELPIGS
ncbi:GIY-YIG nuclease family protein [Streptomyces sp. NPDC051572]|uniref:GIY-YIG nuclease family protein n=1 Tax=unclassified Streptomyces TaxID=2593676 RepID=UPI00344C1EDD